jgi:hypothetical protein
MTRYLSPRGAVPHVRGLLAVLGLFIAAVPGLACASQWRYATLPDPNTGVTLRLATVESFGFEGTLMVRMGPEGSVNVAFGVPATIVCTDPCQVRARLDNDEAMREARYPGAQRNMLFLSPRSLSFAQIQAGRRLDIEVQTREHGWRVLSFDVRGFDSDRLINVHRR